MHSASVVGSVLIRCPGRKVGSAFSISEMVNRTASASHREGLSNNLYVESWTAGAASSGGMSIANAITAGNWMHVALTVNSSNVVTLYVNGTAAGSYTATSAINYAGWTKNYIGASNWAVDRQFRGAMDDIAIFDKALSAGEVATLASSVTAPTIVNKSIAENSANGTNVFDARSSDVDASDGVTYSILSGNTNNTFAINSSSGQVTVLNSSMLNFETKQSVRTGCPSHRYGGLSTDQTVTVTVTDINEAPTDITLGAAPTGLTTAGNASLVSGTTYQLTPNANNQAGAVWGQSICHRILSLHLGPSSVPTIPVRMVLPLHFKTKAATGGSGRYGDSVSTSLLFGIAFDTWFNISTRNQLRLLQFFRQGATANQGTTFDTANAHDNLEDGLWRDLVITWKRVY